MNRRGFLAKWTRIIKAKCLGLLIRTALGGNPNFNLASESPKVDGLDGWGLGHLRKAWIPFMVKTYEGAAIMTNHADWAKATIKKRSAEIRSVLTSANGCLYGVLFDISDNDMLVVAAYELGRQTAQNRIREMRESLLGRKKE